jgi:hypothetical protein
MNTREAVETMSNFVNSFSRNHEEFCKEMSKEHRTLQQSFTRLCLEWIEHVSKEEYITDSRNMSSKIISRELLKGFKEQKKKEGYAGSALETMSIPSKYIAFI